MTTRNPSYRYHKARNCAVVTIGGKDHYLGQYDRPESWEQYHRLVAEWLAVRNEPPILLNSTSSFTHGQRTVAALLEVR